MTEFTTDRRGAILEITLDNPRRGNALSRDAAAALADVFDDVTNGGPDVSDRDVADGGDGGDGGDVADGGGGVRAILVRAVGVNFCTGADIGGSRTSGRPVNGHMVRGMGASHHRLVRSAFECRVPVVAAVQGAAIGAGLHLALAADFVIASELAFFQEPFTERGFSVDSGGSWLIPRLIGLPRAKQLLYLAERVDASTALGWGLIAEVVPSDDLDVVARRRTAALASRPTQAVAATKRLLHDGLRADLDQALHAESMAVELTLRSNDFKEGMTAFVEKRPPRFTGT